MIGLTQQQLAAAADCSLSYVRLLESGFAPASSDVLPRIAAALVTETSNVAIDSRDVAKTSDAGGGHVSG
jgi:transcriptional regulator with XRE-family HTH domain